MGAFAELVLHCGANPGILNFATHTASIEILRVSIIAVFLGGHQHSIPTHADKLAILWLQTLDA